MTPQVWGTGSGWWVRSRTWIEALSPKCVGKSSMDITSSYRMCNVYLKEHDFQGSPQPMASPLGIYGSFTVSSCHDAMCQPGVIFYHRHLLTINSINIPSSSGLPGAEPKVKFVLREGERVLLTSGSEEGAVYAKVWESERTRWDPELETVQCELSTRYCRRWEEG